VWDVYQSFIRLCSPLSGGLGAGGHLQLAGDGGGDGPEKTALDPLSFPFNVHAGVLVGPNRAQPGRQDGLVHAQFQVMPARKMVSFLLEDCCSRSCLARLHQLQSSSPGRLRYSLGSRAAGGP